MGLTELVSASFGYEPEKGSMASNSRTTFQWGGSISALLLLILNRTAKRSLPTQTTTLLVLYLLTSLPNALYNVIRGSLGSWISFIGLAANLYSPDSFPVARVAVFVAAPDSVTEGLRDTSAGAVFCLVIGVFLGLAKLRRFMSDSEWNLHSVCYFICVAFLLYFTATLWK